MNEEVKSFIQICADNNLIISCNGKELPFREVIKEIYYNWNMEDLQNFMNDLLYSETQIGEVLFDEEQTY